MLLSQRDECIGYSCIMYYFEYVKYVSTDKLIDSVFDLPIVVFQILLLYIEYKKWCALEHQIRRKIVTAMIMISCSHDID